MNINFRVIKYTDNIICCFLQATLASLFLLPLFYFLHFHSFLSYITPPTMPLLVTKIVDKLNCQGVSFRMKKGRIHRMNRVTQLSSQYLCKPFCCRMFLRNCLFFFKIWLGSTQPSISPSFPNRRYFLYYRKLYSCRERINSTVFPGQIDSILIINEFFFFYYFNSLTFSFFHVIMSYLFRSMNSAVVLRNV